MVDNFNCSLSRTQSDLFLPHKEPFFKSSLASDFSLLDHTCFPKATPAGLFLTSLFLFLPLFTKAPTPHCCIWLLVSFHSLNVTLIQLMACCLLPVAFPPHIPLIQMLLLTPAWWRGLCSLRCRFSGVLDLVDGSINEHFLLGWVGNASSFPVGWLPSLCWLHPRFCNWKVTFSSVEMSSSSSSQIWVLEADVITHLFTLRKEPA